MKKSFSCLMALLTAITFMCSCSSEHPYSIVFCDFTSSIDSVKSIDKIKSDALKILDKEGTERQIDFYTITKKISTASPFISTPLENDPRPSDREEFKQELQERKKELEKMLNEESSKALVNRKEPNSCIIDCIEKALNDFKNYSDSKKISLKLYILSDMLECCAGKEKTTVCIDNYTSNIGSEIGKIDGMVIPSLTFRDFPNLKVYIILASDQNDLINETVFREFWSPVFARYGYKEPLRPRTSLPPELLSK